LRAIKPKLGYVALPNAEGKYEWVI
jgi:hypothetical protein